MPEQGQKAGKTISRPWRKNLENIIALYTELDIEIQTGTFESLSSQKPQFVKRFTVLMNELVKMLSHEPEPEQAINIEILISEFEHDIDMVIDKKREDEFTRV